MQLVHFLSSGCTSLQSEKLLRLICKKVKPGGFSLIKAWKPVHTLVSKFTDQRTYRLMGKALIGQRTSLIYNWTLVNSTLTTGRSDRSLCPSLQPAYKSIKRELPICASFVVRLYDIISSTIRFDLIRHRVYIWKENIVCSQYASFSFLIGLKWSIITQIALLS